MDYFPHDTQAMSDDKLLALRITKGLEAVACYWAVLEKIYADEAPFDVSETNVEATSVSYKLGVGFDVLRDYVLGMERVGLLYRFDGVSDVFMSERAEGQIGQLEKKRKTARQNGKSGGRKPSKNQSGNQRKTNVGSDVKPKSGDIKTLNIKHKKGDAAVGCGADKAAPTTAETESKVPVCPLCKSPVIFDAKSMAWRCDICGEIKAPSFEGAVA